MNRPIPTWKKQPAIPSRHNQRSDGPSPDKGVVERFTPRTPRKPRSKSGPVRIIKAAQRPAPAPQAVLIRARIAHYEDQLARQETWDAEHPDKANPKRAKALASMIAHLQTLLLKTTTGAVFEGGHSNPTTTR